LNPKKLYSKSRLEMIAPSSFWKN